MATNIIAVADLHINSTVAICPKTINLDDGGTYHASRAQRWLLDGWTAFWQEVNSLDGRNVLVLGGDLAELDTQRRSVQLITANKSTIHTMAMDVLEPALAVADAVVVIRGTLAHVGKGAWIEEQVAGDIDDGLIIRQDESAASHYHLRRTVDGVRLDIAHHTTAGGAPWSKRNSPGNMASKIAWLYKIEMDAQAPHIVIRAHNHQAMMSPLDPRLPRVIMLPAWTLATEYSYRIGLENAISSIGGAIITCDAGQHTERFRLYEPDGGNRRIWAKTI